MAYLFTAASSQYFLGGSAPVTADGCTLACWYRPTAIDQSALVVLGNATTSARIQLWADSGGVYGTRFNNAATSTMASASATNSAGVWVHCAVTFDVSGSNITAYGNGVAGSPISNPGGAITLNRITVGTRYNGSSFGLFAGGDIAEVGIYNAILSADEIAAMAKGYKCSDIRPQSLRFDFRMIRDLQDLSGGIVMTNTGGATVSSHPRIIFP